MAASVADAFDHIGRHRPDFALIEYVLPDGDGVQLACALGTDTRVVLMRGEEIDEEDRFVCEAHGFHVLVKPFLSEELIAALEAQGMRLPRAASRGA